MMREDEAATLDALRQIWAGIFNPAVAERDGRVVKMMGDGALAEFASAVDAVEAAIATQQAMAEYNSARPGHEPVNLRIGINLGEIVVEDGDIFGDGVNVAARLEAKAPRGGVLVSDSVHAQVRGKIDAEFADAGEYELKNIDAPVRAWRWGCRGEEPGPAAAVPPVSDGRPSIAVLPFDNISGDPEQDVFADGLVEDVITTLSKLAGLRVIARNSSFAYKGKATDVREVARQLGVGFVLEGSVRTAGNRVRITAQLIDARDGSHLWAERFDRTMDDIFAIQDEITLALATEMQVNLTEGEQARLRYTTTHNVEAWTCWVKGMSHYRQAVTKQTMGPARFHWEEALKLDPDSAALNAMLGFMHCLDARFGWWDERDAALQTAHGYINRAMELDPENADAHSISGLLHLIGERFDEAVRDARRAVELAPGSADVAELASFVLTPSGHPEEAVVQSEKAIALNPNYPAVYLGALGNAYHMSGRLDEAIEAFEAYHARNPGFGLVDLVIIHHETGALDQARATARDLLRARPDFTISSWRKTQFRRDKQRLEDDIVSLADAGLPVE